MKTGQKPWWTRVIEVAWLVLGLIALVAGAQTWRDALIDKRAVEALPAYRTEGPRGILLRGSERTAFARVLLQVCFLGVGVLALLVPRPVRPVNRRSTVFVSVVFIGLEGLLTWDAVMERRDRQRINLLLDQRHRDREARRASTKKGV